MNVLNGHIEKQFYLGLFFLLLMPFAALCNSDFKVAYEVDDQIISNYDIDQAKKLHNLLTGSNHKQVEVEKIVVNSKIKQIYGDRLQIFVSDAELEDQLNSFLKSNKMKLGRLKSLMNSKGLNIETFYTFLKENIR